MVSHILCTSSLRISTSFSSGVFDLSRMTNSSTVRLRLGSGENSLRLTCGSGQDCAQNTESHDRRLKSSHMNRHMCAQGDGHLLLINVQVTESCPSPQASRPLAVSTVPLQSCDHPNVMLSHLENCFHERLARSLLPADVMAPDIDQQHICHSQGKQCTLPLKVGVIFTALAAV